MAWMRVMAVNTCIVIDKLNYAVKKSINAVNTALSKKVWCLVGV